MAIQMRRGNKADFDPTKMLPGEWAVSIDSDTTKQWVWMCFAPGVVKRMAAFEDIEWVLSDEFAKSAVICDVELDSTATKEYAVGDFLMLHGHLYEVTVAITTGDTIEEDVNVTETKVMDTIAGKVDKETGKGLSTNDYTDAEKAALAQAQSDIVSLNADLANKQDASTAVRSVNGNLPTNGAVEVTAEDIPADGIGDKSVSGNPIIVNDAMASVAKSLSVDLEPVQDLHGYDHPWVGGAGKNKLPNGEADIPYRGITFTRNSDGSVSASGTNDGTGASMFVLARQMVLSAGTYILTGGISADISVIVRQGDTSGTQIVSDTGRGNTFSLESDTSVGVIIRITSGTANVNVKVYPMICLSSDPNPTTFAPYENICPIYPHTQAEVQRTGKNLLENNQQSATVSGLTVTVNDDKSMIINGTATALIAFSMPITLKKGTYILSGCPAGGSDSSYRLDTNSLGAVAYDYGNSATFTLTNDASGYIRVRIANGTTVDNLVFKPMVCFASETDLTYEPYQSSSAVMPFGQDVYGCHADFVTGKVRVTWVKQTFDGSSDEGWLMGGWSDGSRFLTTISPLCSGVVTDIKFNCLFTLQNVADQRVGGGKIYASDTIDTYWPTSIADVPAFRAYLASNNLEAVYKLATPIELDLTPAQLTLLEGTNILTADGTINLTYLGSMASDVQAEIDEFESGLNNVIGSIAFIENTTAKTSHVVGDYVILGGIFCKVISAISSGETLSFGTNIQPTTIGAELRTIWAQISA